MSLLKSMYFHIFFYAFSEIIKGYNKKKKKRENKKKTK